MAMYPPPGTRRRAHKCNSFECSMGAGGGTDQQKKQVLKRSRSKQSRVRTPPRGNVAAPIVAMLHLADGRLSLCAQSPKVRAGDECWPLWFFFVFALGVRVRVS